MGPKEYLDKNCPLKGTKGHQCVKLGRGRLSGEHHEILSEAVKNGAKITGYAPVETENRSGQKRIRNEAARSGESTTIADIAPPLHAEKDFQAYALVDGKKVNVGMREVCSTLIPFGQFFSLTYCPCDNHTVSTVLLDKPEPVPVYLESRTVPLKKPW